METENEFYRISVDPKGGICGLLDKVGNLELIAERRLAENWRLLLPVPRKGLQPQVNYLLSTRQSSPTVRKMPDGLELRWDGPLEGDAEPCDISVTSRIRFVGPAVEMALEVENRTVLTLAEVWCGGLGGLMGVGQRTQTETLVPGYNAARTTSLFRDFPESMGPGSGGGFRFPEYYTSYPDMAMAWMSLYNLHLGRGVYYACHDVVPRAKVFHAEMHPTLARLRTGGNWPSEAELEAQRETYPAGLVLHWVHLPYQAPGTTFHSAPIAVQCHEGDWHSAAKLYRKWFTSNFPLRTPADGWYRRQQAVADTFLMLPEGNVLTAYEDIPALARGAAKYGVKTIMVSGWSRGGHDNQYPHYAPDERLGTWEQLREAIRTCHRQGVKVVFFANIDPVNTSTEWYKKELHRYQVVRGNGTIPTMGWGMGTLSARLGMTAPPLTSCDVAFEAYRKIIVSQMRRLAEIGADGIHFDKVAGFAINFNPALPGDRDSAMFAATLGCIEETLEQCRRLVPDFAVSVEASWDRLLSYADAWWNWIDDPNHVAATKYCFPEFLPNYAIVSAHDYVAVNSAMRYGYQMLIGPVRWSASMDDPQTRPLSRYIREAIGIREELKDTIFLGEFLDTLEVSVAPREHLRYNTHRNPSTGRRACVLANNGREDLTTTVRFQRNRKGKVAVYWPFEEVIRTRLPVAVPVAAERFAVVVEE